jgi:hypothetical protein
MAKISNMSNEVVKVMNQLRYNDRLVSLLIIDKDSSNFDIASRPDGFNSFQDNMEKKNIQIIKQSDSFCRISPTPFDPEATIEDKSMIRAYYSTGELDGERIRESSFVIDIIVSKNLWLAWDESYKKEFIRPYEIMEEIVNTIGRRSGNPIITMPFNGFQHLSVNSKFDAIRLFSDYFSPETTPTDIEVEKSKRLF